MKQCPTCNKEFRPEQHDTNMPFCSERCRLIDLGAWLSEKHRIKADDIDITADNEAGDHTKH
jgi:uncharacterized protein